MATMTDVARLAGVSVSTVSYVLTGARPITPATRGRVECAMRELGYTPNALARGLKSKRSQIVALMFPSRGRGLDLSGLDYIIGASDHAQELGYHLLLWTTDVDSLDQLRALFRQGLVDGTLVMEVEDPDPRIPILLEGSVPYTLIGRGGDLQESDYVDTDFEQCAALAMQHLADLGHRQVGFVNQAGEDGLESRLGPALRAREGVLRVAREVGLEVDVSCCAPSFEAGRGAFAELVRRRPGVTAAVVVNEQALPGMISAANEHGRRIPDDFSVLGIALGPQAAAMTVPPTTTVSAPGREMGRRAVEVLVGRLEGSVAPPHHELFPGVLTVRGTTAVARCR